MKTQISVRHPRTRSFSGDRSGAAEIIGDILLVSMSVMMVSLLALQLSSVQNPADSTRVDLGASYDGQNITVLHMGGESLQNYSTKFYISLNDTLVRRANITDGKPGASWRMGENWTFSFPSGANQRLKIQVIDTKNNAVILDQMLQRGPEAASLPDLGLSVSDITVLYNGHTFNDSGNPMTGDIVIFNVTLHNFGTAPAYNFTVRLSVYSTIDRKTYAVSSQNMSMNGTSTKNITASYTIPGGSWGMNSVSVRMVPLPNETRFGNNYASKEFRVGYVVIASHPGNPVLRIRSIESFPRYPVHGAFVNLTARISNQGGVPANATVKYYLGSVLPANLMAVDSPVGVPVGGESLSTVIWKTPRGGLQTIIVNVTDPTGTTDQQSLQVEVMSTILLVDDDRAGDGAPKDVVTSMKNALSAAAASYTVHIVGGGGDGPQYSGGDHQMKDYDLVIWLTGYENANTLTNNDQTQLTTYLNNKGRLWLIGEDILSQLRKNNNFLKNMMKVDPTMPDTYYGVGVPISSRIIGMNILNLTVLPVNRPFIPSGLPDRTDAMLPSAKGVPAFSEYLGQGRPLAILFNATTNGTPGDDTYRAAFFGFEPSQVAQANDRGIMTYEMLRWFGVLATWGRDLAVPDQKFSHGTPAFMEDVNITIFLRNNGLTDEPVDTSRPQLQVGFYIDGASFAPKQVTIESNGGLTIFYPPTSEIWIPQDTTNASLKVAGSGGFIKVSMVWTADKIGQHTVVGRVDPYDYIQEISESNNEVFAVSAKTIYVRYGTLIVDDDESANNAGGHYNATQNITAAFDLLGYQYDIVVNHQNDDGPTLTKMELYNAIIWCAGEESAPLNNDDKTNLGLFLNKGDGRNLWMMGSRVVPDGTYGQGGDAFFRDYLRVARVSDPRGVDPGIDRTPSSIEGAYQDPGAHGVKYAAIPTFTDSGRLVVPYPDGRGTIYQKPMPSTSVPNEMVYCDAQDGAITGWFTRPVQPGTTSTVSNVYDGTLGSRVIQLTRAGANPANPNYFLLGDYSLTINDNPNSLAWKDEQRNTTQWSFKVGMDYTFIWHVTDNLGAHHTLTYTNSNVNSLGNEPIHHGLGAFTADGQWHTVTRDLVRDLREGTGAGALTIREVDGFELAIRTGSGWVDNITLSRPFNTVRYESIVGNFKTVFCAWDPSFISFNGNNDSIGELTYLVMSWFNMYDERTELRVTHLDLYHGNMTPLRDMKPMIGESYMLKAKVWNPGGARGDAVVRFSDGSTVIDSVSISVEHDSFVLAEIIWTPLYAGNRTLSVAVDPDGLLEEIFKFNNGANISIQTYFFYDDMESGPNKWRHESTIVRLNGESPIEYLDPGPANTNVVGQWGQWNGFRNNTDNASATCITSIYHTTSRAFYMHEPKLAARAPADIIIVIDRSGSMNGQKITDARDAASFFVDQLNTTLDRVSVWSYSWYTSTPRMNLGFTTNFALAKITIQNLAAGGNTAGYTAMGEATQYCIDNARANAVRAVVFLTDGQFNEDLGFYQEATTLATVANLGGPLFTIGLGAGVDSARLTNCAAASQGGSYYFAPTSAQLQGIYLQIAAVIESMAQPIGRSTAEGAADGRADVIIFQDDFENDLGWVVNNVAGFYDWDRTNHIDHSGDRSYRMGDHRDGGYVNGEIDYLTSPVLDLSGNYSSARISFWSYEDVESGYDFCSVYVSNDNGASWTVMWSRASRSTVWSQLTNIDMALYVPLTSQMRVRFIFTSDGSVTYTGWAVDDFMLNATRAAPPPPPPKGPTYWIDGDENPRDKSITTATFSLQDVQSARLTFWHRYNLKVGSNGGVLLVGTAASEGGTWTYKYISPTQPYPNNLKISEWGTPHLDDGLGNDMRWCWNGISGAGKFSWDYGEADLTQFVGNQFVRVRFQYLYCDGGTGYGWAIDDVEIKARRSDASAVTATSNDQWELVSEGSTYGDDFADARFAYNGRYSWWNHNPQIGIDTLKGGIDNSLTSIPIDLSRAKDATLVAKLRFNFAYPEGRPPDGFRVEVSNNNGIIWRQINMGIRSSWNVSGRDAAGPDGTSYTGVNLGDNWTSSNTLTRLNCDLSGWAGSVIQIRFRLVTRNDTAQHYDDLTDGFGGFFIDDVTVIGNTTTGQGRAAGSREQAANDGQQGAGNGQQAANDGQQGAGSRQQEEGRQAERTRSSSSPAACCLLPAASPSLDRKARPADSRLPTE
jgi:uncharacterized protein YegL